MKTSIIQRGWIEKLELKAMLIFTLVSFLFPLLVHLVGPIDGTPIGAKLLPIFYAPFIAAFLYRYHVALIAAIFAPILNYMITGHPAPAMVMVLTFELVLFVSLVYLLRKKKTLSLWLIAPLSYVLVKGFTALVISLFPGLSEGTISIDFYLNSFTNSTMGIAILLAINILVHRFQEQIRI